MRPLGDTARRANESTGHAAAKLRRRIIERAGPDDAGSAIVEFLGIALILLVPTVYLVLVLGKLQAGAFAAESAAAQSARAFVIAADVEAGQRAAVASVRLALEDQGFDGTDAESALALDCSSVPCREPGSTVATRVQIDVALPLVPSFVRDVVPLSVRVSADHVAAVDQYGGSG